MQNPIIKVLMLVAGVYLVLSKLQNAGPLVEILTVAAGVCAAIIWMANYNKGTLYDLSLKPGVGPVINAVCKFAKEQPPTGPEPQPGAPPAPGGEKQQPETPKLLLHSDPEFRAAGEQIKETILGHDPVIDVLMDQIRTNVQLRDNASMISSMPPVGVYILAGNPGLGKKSLATEIGSRLYKAPSVSMLDVSDPAAGGALLVAEARMHPFTTFILENFQNCPQPTQEELLSIIAGAPQVDRDTGAKVSFRHCFFFLLVHRDASGMPMPSTASRGNTGQTLVIEELGSTMNLDKRLGWSIHGIFPFVLPSLMKQAEIVADIMQQECRKYNLTLGRVDPAIIGREVEVVTQHGGFEITPPRVAKMLSNRLAAAVAAREQLVDVDEQSLRGKPPTGAHQRYVPR